MQSSEKPFREKPFYHLALLITAFNGLMNLFIVRLQGFYRQIFKASGQWSKEEVCNFCITSGTKSNFSSFCLCIDIMALAQSWCDTGAKLLVCLQYDQWQTLFWFFYSVIIVAQKLSTSPLNRSGSGCISCHMFLWSSIALKLFLLISWLIMTVWNPGSLMLLSTKNK